MIPLCSTEFLNMSENELLEFNSKTTSFKEDLKESLPKFEKKYEIIRSDFQSLNFTTSVIPDPDLEKLNIEFEKEKILVIRKMSSESFDSFWDGWQAIFLYEKQKKWPYCCQYITEDIKNLMEKLDNDIDFDKIAKKYVGTCLFVIIDRFLAFIKFILEQDVTIQDKFIELVNSALEVFEQHTSILIILDRVLKSAETTKFTILNLKKIKIVVDQ